jgi:hypothetical protein
VLFFVGISSAHCHAKPIVVHLITIPHTDHAHSSLLSSNEPDYCDAACFVSHLRSCENEELTAQQVYQSVLKEERHKVVLIVYVPPEMGVCPTHYCLKLTLLSGIALVVSNKLLICTQRSGTVCCTH